MEEHCKPSILKVNWSSHKLSNFGFFLGNLIAVDVILDTIFEPPLHDTTPTLTLLKVHWAIVSQSHVYNPRSLL